MLKHDLYTKRHHRLLRLLRWAFASGFGLLVVSSLACSSFLASECRSSGDCQGGQVCALGMCQTAGQTTCSLDGSCPIDHACQGGVCIKRGNPTGCQVDQECLSEYLCRGGVCIEKPKIPTPPVPAAICLPTVQLQTLSHEVMPQAQSLVFFAGGRLVAGLYYLPQNAVYEIRIRELATDKILHIFPATGKRAPVFAVRPDGRYIAISSDPDALQLRDVATGALVHTYQLKGALQAIGFRKDSRYMFAYGKDRLQLWESSTHNLIVALSMKFNRLEAVGFSDEGTALLFCGFMGNHSPQLGRLVLATKQLSLLPLDGIRPNAGYQVLGFSSGGSRFSLVETDNLSVGTWDAASGKRIDEQRLATLLPGEYPIHFAFDAPRQRLALVTTVRLGVWSLVDGALLNQLKYVGSQLYRREGQVFLYFSADGKRVLAAGHRLYASWDFAAKDAAEGDAIETAGILAFDASSQQMVMAAPTGELLLWKTAAQAPAALERLTNYSLPLPSQIVYQDGGKTLLSFSRQGLFRRWQTGDAPSFQSEYWYDWLPKGERLQDARLGPKGATLAVATFADPSNRAIFRIWDVKTKKPLHTLYDSDKGRVDRFSFRLDGKGLVASIRLQTGQYSVVVWSLESGKELFSTSYYLDNHTRSIPGRPVGQTIGIDAVALRPDGKQLAVAVEQRGRGIDLWSLSDDKPIMVEGDEAFVHGFSMLRYSPDGLSLAAASRSNIVFMFDVPKVAQVRQFKPDVTVVDMDFRPDGKIFACVTGVGQSLLWDMSSGKQLLTMRSDGQDRLPHHIIFRPDGQGLAVTGLDSLIRLWSCPALP